MPPSPIIDQKSLLQAAIDLIRENGIENLNARSLAHKLNCSTKPIFRIYESMEALKDDAYKQAEKIYEEYLFSIKDDSISPFLQVGINYVRFSHYEKNLFKFIFLSDYLKISSFDSIVDMADMPQIIDGLVKVNQQSAEDARLLYTSLWSVTHGISCTIATNQYNLNEKEVLKLLSINYQGVLSQLKKGE